MISYHSSETDDDLRGIIDLQSLNLEKNLSDDQVKSQGFVTVRHSFEVLQKMNSIEKNIIAKDNDKVIAYLIAMTAASQADVPILVPMFDKFKKINYLGSTIADFRYLVVGQVCVADGYRGQGVLDGCYNAYRQAFSLHYDFAITEIATRNLRSIHAHKRIGFQEIANYTSENNETWSIVLWDWK